jgi:ParB-like chromosome segregation protein Spo0J
MTPTPISSSKQIRTSAIQPGRNPWRDGDTDTSDLEESLKHAPMLHPLVVQLVPGSTRRFEVISGNRRLAASKKLGHSHVEARVVAVDDLMREQLNLEENLRRASLGRREPRAMARLLEIYAQQYPKRPGRPKKNGPRDRISSLQATSRVVGKSPREVRRLARVGAAPEPVRQAYEEGRITLKQAEAAATGSARLVNLTKPDLDVRVLDAIRYALRLAKARRPRATTRRQAKLLLDELKAALE